MMTTFLRVVTVSVLLSLATLPAAWATHEIDHRYDVTGFVLDANEQPIANSPVSIRLGNDVIGHQQTNGQGYYRIRLHLHDADLGKKLTVKTAAGEAVIRVTLTPGDAKTERIHYANLVGGKLTEQRLSKSRYRLWLYGVPALLVLASIAAIIVSRRNRRRAKIHAQSVAGVRRRRKRKR